MLHNPESLNNMIHAETPAEEKWRIGFLKELIQLREGKYELQNNLLTKKEIEGLITFVATTWAGCIVCNIEMGPHLIMW